MPPDRRDGDEVDKAGGGPEARPAEAQQLYRLIFHGTRDIILFMAGDGRILEANEAAVLAYGHTRGELLSLRVQDLRDASTLSEVPDQMDMASSDGVLFETTHRRKDGSTFPVEVSSRAVTFAGRQTLLSVIRDITRRKEDEAERERLLGEVGRKAAELTSVLDNMLDAVIVCDGQGRITLMNQASIRMVGEETARKLDLSPADIAVLDLRHLDGRPFEWRDTPVRRALAGEVTTTDDVTMLLPITGRRVRLRVTASPIRGADDKVDGAVMVARDISDSVELDRLKEQFTAVAAHELKTPVTIMKGYSQLLLRRHKDLTLEQKQALEEIDRGADRINRIVMDLLDISSLQVGPMRLARERMDLVDLVNQVVSGLASNAPDHRLQVSGLSSLVLAADAERLTQVLGNLVENAIRYSPQGGLVTVLVSSQNGMAVVSVEDEGVGIPQDRQGRIFQHFYRAHAGTPHDYGGMGVGLFISREIVNRHGGEMWFRSQEGAGSTFFFSIPVDTLGVPTGD